MLGRFRCQPWFMFHNWS
ncbi:unnamed protein product [Linum tenue]|uniref:Uncharacterized protein n=1 Tax=Linum tenue TaxID=586396 RepID=A0AAV0HCY4_9ROSI|nr:unnamed protein product [Linum tenue]